jgi:uncharacterized protein (TIGR02117 family)
VVTARPGDPSLWPPAPDTPATDVYVISHGYHAGIAISTARVAEVASQHGYAALIAIAQRFAAYPFIEIGWGDEGFYTSVPDTGSLSMGIALRALFRPGNASVVHVVGLSQAPSQVFPSADIVRIKLGENGLVRMMQRLDQSFARSDSSPTPQLLGKGLYGPSLFYRANGSFHIFNVCNHWVAHLLSVAGLPTAPVLAILPAGLLFDLKWRAGIDPLPPTNGTR